MKIADFPIFRKANKAKVIVIDIPKPNHLILDIDGKYVEIEKKIIKEKDESRPESIDVSRVVIKCYCEECSMIGINHNTICRRQYRAIDWLMEHGGRILIEEDGGSHSW